MLKYIKIIPIPTMTIKHYTRKVEYSKNFFKKTIAR